MNEVPTNTDPGRQAIVIGRYLLHRQIARGGMATIHIARLVGDEGFTRIVAAKRLHPEFAEDHDFVQMFLDEARIASKVHHRNVVPVLDVGIAKATMAAHATRQGTFKGKLAHSAPEQIRGNATQQSDIYSLSVVLWELLVGHRLHNSAQSEGELIAEVMTGSLPKVTEVLAPEREWLGENRWKQLEALDPILQRGLAVDMTKRWPTAAAMEAALASAVQPASSTGVAGWLKTLGRDFLSGRDRVIALEEASWRRTAERVPRRMSQNGLVITEPGTSAAAPPALARHRTRLLAGAGIGAFLLILAVIIWIP